MITETVLCFGYPFKYEDNAIKLTEVLQKENIGFIFYKSNGYWNHEFIVRRSGKTWNDIMKTINSVMAVKYKKEKKTFDDDFKHEIVVHSER